LYFDTCYIAKFYFNEPESARVRELVRSADRIQSSRWAVPELHGVIHRQIREGTISAEAGREISTLFYGHVKDGLWHLLPVNEALLRRTSALLIAAPSTLFVRTADAVHLVTAQEAGEQEIWTNDRHMLAAAGYFGVAGRSI
jgi:predicted nucleic acid-binding protein